MVRLILVVLYARAGRANTEVAAQVQWYWGGFAITAVLWLTSVAVAPPGRWFVWAFALLVDVGIPVVSDRRRGLLPVEVHHLPDRFAAFVIIVLGESLITTATLAVDSRALTGPRVTLLAASFLLAAALWWGFFDRITWQRRYRQMAGDNSGRLASPPTRRRVPRRPQGRGAANQRISDALGTTEPEPGPGDEGDADSEPAA